MPNLIGNWNFYGLCFNMFAFQGQNSFIQWNSVAKTKIYKSAWEPSLLRPLVALRSLQQYFHRGKFWKEKQIVVDILSAVVELSLLYSVSKSLIKPKFIPKINKNCSKVELYFQNLNKNHINSFLGEWKIFLISHQICQTDCQTIQIHPKWI